MKRLLLMLLLIPLVAVSGCSGGRGEPCAKDADCGTNLSCQDLICRSVEDIRFCSDRCAEVGWCTLKDGECQATSDADCKSSDICKEEGACTAWDLLTYGDGQCRKLVRRIPNP